MICALFKVRSPNRRKRVALASVLVGIILYGGEIGVIPFDLFELGYNPLYSLGFVIIGMLLSDALGAVVFLLAYALYNAGIYDNYFTSLIDPVLWGVAIVYLIKEGVRGSRQ